MNTWMRRAAAALLAAGVASCATPGGVAAPPAGQPRATVHGDLPMLTAGLPLAVVLRSVDGQALGFGRASAEVAPGRHTFLVDCTVTGTGATSRHAVEAEVFAGRSYRLEADASPTRCNGVTLVER